MRRGEASEQVWLEILQDFEDTAFPVSLVKKLPEKIVDLLSEHDEEGVRRNIAMKGNIKSFPHAYERLSKDRSLRVRMNL